MSEIFVSAEISFVNLNLSRISAETKISDLSKISTEIWLRLETFRESGPSIFKSPDIFGNIYKFIYDRKCSCQHLLRFEKT